MSPQKLSAVLMLALSTAAVTAQARDNEQPYVGLDYSLLQIEDEQSGSDAEPQAIRLRAGTVLAKYLAVEAQLAGNLASDDINDARVALKANYGLYLRPQLSMGALHLYALAGYNHVNVDVGPYDDDDEGFSYGVGVQLDIKGHWSLNASYINHYDSDDVTIDSLNAGVVYRL